MRKCKLKDLIEVSRGATLPGRFYSTEGDLIRLTLGNFDYNNGGFKQNTSKEDIYYTGDVRPEFILNEGDIITPLTEQAVGLLGTTAKIPESGKYIQSQDVALVKCLEGLYPGYCYYLLPSNTVKRQLSVGAQQTSIRHTSPDKIKDCWVYILEKDEQKKVADFLDMFERKIAINRRINERLEGMAKLLYDYWFVQFDFPNEEGKPYKSSGGKMVWNEKLKREIPEGWEVKKLNDFLLASENGDWGDECDLRDSVKVNCVRGADIIDLMSAPERYLSNKKKDKLLREHDIIVEVSGGSPIQATGRCNYVSKGVLEMYDNRLTCSNFCKFLRLSNMEYAAFFYYLWRLFYDNGNMFHYESKTSGIKNLQIDALLSEYWYVPPIHLASIFQKTSTMLFAKMDNDKKESNCLTSLRDFLLPMLMNGQVEIKEK